MAVGSRAATRGHPGIPHSAFRISAFASFIPHSAFVYFRSARRLAKRPYAPGPPPATAEEAQPGTRTCPAHRRHEQSPWSGSSRDRALDERRVRRDPNPRNTVPLCTQPRQSSGPISLGRGTRGSRSPGPSPRGLIGHPVVRARDREAIRREATVHKRVLLVWTIRDRRRGRSPAAVRCSRRARVGLVRRCRPRSRRTGKDRRARAYRTEQLDRHAHACNARHAIGRART